MRYWRAREYAEGLAPKTATFGLSLWAFAAKRPALYRSDARRLRRVLLKLMGGRRGHDAGRPRGLTGWFVGARFSRPGRQDISRAVEGAQMSAPRRDPRRHPCPAHEKRHAAAAPIAQRRLAKMPPRSSARRRRAPQPKSAGWESLRDVPAAIADALRARNMAAGHPSAGEFAAGQSRSIWSAAPASTAGTPRPDRTTRPLSIAPLRHCRNGTLGFRVTPDAPASWHFRPGLEIAIVRTANILADFEAVLARAKAEGLARDAQSRHRPVAHRRHRADDRTRRAWPEKPGRAGGGRVAPPLSRAGRGSDCSRPDRGTRRCGLCHRARSRYRARPDRSRHSG